MPDESPDCTAWLGPTPVAISPLGGSGFSGSRVFLVQDDAGGRFVLKQFATGTPVGRAEWVHALMRHLRGAGLDTVPEVIAIRAGRPPCAAAGCATLAVDPAGVRWELLAFVPGSPRPAATPEEAATALAGLARLHRAAAAFPASAPCLERSAGIARRVEQASRMLASPWRRLACSATPELSAAILGRLRDAVDIFEMRRGDSALERMAMVAPIPIMIQPVLRDVWSDHVLFAADGALAGFVDFHAAGRDTPATDIARLLGSWHHPHDARRAPLPDRWRKAIDAYETVRPLSSCERRLVPWLDATGVICGLDNWFRWLITDGRRFDDISRVLARIDRLVSSLPDALETMRDAIPGPN